MRDRNDVTVVSPTDLSNEKLLELFIQITKRPLIKDMFGYIINDHDREEMYLELVASSRGFTFLYHEDTQTWTLEKIGHGWLVSQIVGYLEDLLQTYQAEMY